MKTKKASKTNTRSRIIFFATLTPKEREIFDYYLVGIKTSRIIQTITYLLKRAECRSKHTHQKNHSLPDRVHALYRPFCRFR